jgi:hypothetical protein
VPDQSPAALSMDGTSSMHIYDQEGATMTERGYGALHQRIRRVWAANLNPIPDLEPEPDPNVESDDGEEADDADTPDDQ